MISLLSPLISLQNRQKCRFEPTLKKCSRNKALRAKKPYSMRLLAQTRRPETDTKRPKVDTLTKRLEISLRAIAHVFESHPLRQRARINPVFMRVFIHILLLQKSTHHLYWGANLDVKCTFCSPMVYPHFWIVKKWEGAKKRIAQRQNFLISCRNVIASLKNKVLWYNNHAT